ncbi:GNAT family N-acetyltransferase [Lederbergia graminis]|uniref:GNAT family N-acetyltransferase n=1 Tax=Lederbergia graminis TaxID=735518 RepID=A0ABW0LLB5_9BACI
MEFRKSNSSDIQSIMKVISEAKVFLKEQGVDQWQNGYPNEESIQTDIKHGESYVLVKKGEVVATAMVTFRGDPAYNLIHEGQWLSNEKYAAVHRVAVSRDHKGLGLSTEILKHVEKLCLEHNVHSIKIDTHKENIPMQKVILKNGFQYCGIVYIDGLHERIAFEKLF